MAGIASLSEALFRTRTGDPLLTMEVSRCGGGQRNSAYLQVFPATATRSLRAAPPPRKSPRPPENPVGVENPDARGLGMRARHRCEVNFASAGRAGAGRVGERRGEEAVGPFLGEAARVGEHQVDFGVAHLEPG
jgi:hypothetical protein